VTQPCSTVPNRIQVNRVLDVFTLFCLLDIVEDGDGKPSAWIFELLAKQKARVLAQFREKLLAKDAKPNPPEFPHEET
jgi:hypothetical protein